MITRYGYDVYFTVAGVCVAAIVIAILFVDPRSVRYAVVGSAGLVLLFATNFFRDPDRVIPSGDGIVVSPADGKVIVVKEVDQPEYIGGPSVQISIFMSPLNVHVNRVPITGTVKHLRYVAGEYFAAFADKASEKNEQMIVGMENARGKVLFKQIAGFVARRIVCELRQDQEVGAGERFGMIKFGSRVDVFVRPSADVSVKIGDVVTAGETILAAYRSP
ncbi:MAG: Phosphatidylserine decarboxylase proenzyme [Candidatus Uhrbacteria bacterium GW2011_GWC2_53_7]|uniref:Phosphatidylserine decarboxylase proenzyme n=1 Tax=Candidatus Uhrbacteria bacterium GW2011_GWC2_53_7 TaxID=1618986 RepID=A0A0G1XYX4_9BACT|nr:MAG: Phosphatidylserine decarboxylase proenzyme [Candidatus Uhrbacteria bacterium GW2011_GWC2_53_7]